MTRAKNSNSGFALVVALSLMAFVLLLVLSMTTLISVEQGSAATSRAKLEAEQNALLALNQALGTTFQRAFIQHTSPQFSAIL